MRKSLKSKTWLAILLVLSLVKITTAQQPAWAEVQTGVWKSVVGTPEPYNLLTAAGAMPNDEVLSKIGNAPFPLNNQAIEFKVFDGKTYLRLPLQKGEQLYGFGLNFQTVHQRGRIMELHVDHYGDKYNGRTHASTPFYVSSKGYGVFINSARYIKVWAGTGVRKDSPEFPSPKDRNKYKTWSSRPYADAVEILVPANGVEVYIFSGPKPLDAVRRYNLFNGGGCLPPRWGLGFTQRVMTMSTAADVEREVDAFAQKGYPL